jgi:tetratricopeptide (TPR) repeat protein
MGLYEDALGEFRICLDSEPRRFDSLYLMGICARDLSRLDESVNYFEQALATAGISGERLVGVYFDLSFAQEGIGEIERAIASVQKVLEVDAEFPGAQDRLAELEAGGASSPSLGEPGEVYESFDDLFEDDDEDGDVEMAQAVPTEAFESFDDVIEDAERVIESEQETSDPEADTKSAKKPGRKKISFV